MYSSNVLDTIKLLISNNHRIQYGTKVKWHEEIRHHQQNLAAPNKMIENENELQENWIWRRKKKETEKIKPNLVRAVSNRKRKKNDSFMFAAFHIDDWSFIRLLLYVVDENDDIIDIDYSGDTIDVKCKFKRRRKKK